jgi:hypothetical protein
MYPSSSNLELSKLDCLKRFRKVIDGENVIWRMHVILTYEQHGHRVVYLAGLESTQNVRFECLGEQIDLSAAISFVNAATQCKTASHP